MNDCVNQMFLLNGNIIAGSQFEDTLIQNELSFYEVIRIIDGKCLFVEDHLMRLQNSIDLFNIHSKPNKKQIITYIQKYLDITRIINGNIKIVVNYKIITDKEPQLLIYQVKHYYPSLQQYQNGVDVALVTGERTNPNSKFINQNIRGLVAQKLLNTQYVETLLVNSKNQITEGSRSNVFFIKSNELRTAPNEIVLPGVTRKHILGICKREKIPVIFKMVLVNELETYEGAFICGTSINVLPVRKIENLTFEVSNKVTQILTYKLNAEIKSYLK